MKDIFSTYLNSVAEKFKHKETSEMGYRADFESLLKNLFAEIKVKRIDHDARAVNGNRPDFVIYREVPILYIEVKDIGQSLDKVENSEQMARYFGYANLILTDYLEFRFYRNGVKYEEPVKIAEYNIQKRTIKPLPENFGHLNKSVLDFIKSHKEPIKTAEHLSKIMGGKARRIRDNVIHFLTLDTEKNRSLLKLYDTLKKMLVHDLNFDKFADLYAQTLVYGLFVARYHDETPDTFNRLEARELVPKSNPLLRHFFDHILGTDYDERLKYIVDELCEVFSHADVPKLMKQYFKDDLWGKTHEGPDPVIHFYEDFLKEYDPELRKKMGAFYTPLSVVRFIVRTVDYLLEKEFGLSGGLSDTSKSEKGIHKVQILDPATGTGTFITEVFRNIYSRFEGQKGRWPKYVFSDLLPRVHGFELMMAPYTIAHLKLSMLLKDTGFKYFNNARLGIYLTNSLEETNEASDLFGGIGFAESIAEESKEASIIKNDTPIMVVIGNPPYSVSSNNKSEWIQKILQVYKANLNEKNIQPLSDDYIKFIRFSEYFIEKNGTGIVAMITNNSYLDGRIHRQMRLHLLETFDDIYIIDLHGNAKKKEKADDGGKDENVFDIQQGVAISIFIKKSTENLKLGNVYFHDIHSKRYLKFKQLDDANINNIVWEKIDYQKPYYFFVKKNFDSENDFNLGFKLNELFEVNTSGVKTHHDDELVSFNEYEDNNFKYYYRPFDIRNIEYDLKKVVRHRYAVMKHLMKANLALLVCKQQSTFDFQHVLITKEIADICAISSQTKESAYVFPLYLYNEDGNKIINFKKDIFNKFTVINKSLEPEELFDYIYAILHSPNYRDKYKELLKIDFPRVPYPKDKKEFDKYVKFGNELRLLHLMESPKLNNFITTYSIEGTDKVDKITYKNCNVYINSEQYFGKVPETAWNFYIGGYQPAQKWLKDRKGRTLTNEDIEHYQKIIVILMETDRIMKEIG